MSLTDAPTLQARLATLIRTRTAHGATLAELGLLEEVGEVLAERDAARARAEATEDREARLLAAVEAWRDGLTKEAADTAGHESWRTAMSAAASGATLLIWAHRDLLRQDRAAASLGLERGAE